MNTEFSPIAMYVPGDNVRFIRCGKEYRGRVTGSDTREGRVVYHIESGKVWYRGVSARDIIGPDL
jgi:hypothetical protein